MSRPPAFLSKFMNNKGYIALLSVLIISAVGSVVALSLLTVGASLGRTSFMLQKGHSAQALALACGNKALQIIRLSASYGGDETVYFGDDFCEILPITVVAGIYTIKTQGSVDPILRKNKIVVLRTEDPDTLAVTMTLESWQEVADF